MSPETSHTWTTCISRLISVVPCWRPFRWRSDGFEWSPVGPNTSPVPPACPGRAAGTAGLIASPWDWHTLHPEETSWKQSGWLEQRGAADWRPAGFLDADADVETTYTCTVHYIIQHNLNSASLIYFYFLMQKSKIGIIICIWCQSHIHLSAPAGDCG